MQDSEDPWEYFNQEGNDLDREWLSEFERNKKSQFCQEGFRSEINKP